MEFTTKAALNLSDEPDSPCEYPMHKDEVQPQKPRGCQLWQPIVCSFGHTVHRLLTPEA